MKLHRSLSFWSGLLLISFICWAWHDSYYYRSHLYSGRSTCMSFWGGVHFSHSGSTPRIPFRVNRVAGPQGHAHFFQRPFFLRGGGQPLPSVFETNYVSPSSYEWELHYNPYYPRSMGLLFIPHWLIVLAIAIPWLGLLVWRARRMKRSRMPNLE